MFNCDNKNECWRYSALTSAYTIPCGYGSHWHPNPSQMTRPEHKAMTTTYAKMVPLLRFLVYSNYHQHWTYSISGLEKALVECLKADETCAWETDTMHVALMKFLDYVLGELDGNDSFASIYSRIEGMRDLLRAVPNPDVALFVIDPERLLISVRFQLPLVPSFNLEKLEERKLMLAMPRMSAALGFFEAGTIVRANSEKFVDALDTISSETSWNNVPDTNFLFVARTEELAAIDRMEKSVVITGMVGAGKTELAIAYANHARPLFEDNIRFIKASSSELLMKSFLELADKLNVERARSDNIIPMIERIYSILGKLDNCLLIFDDVFDPRDIGGFFVRSFLSGDKNHKVIITTRVQNYHRRSDFGGHEKEHTLYLERFTEPEALALAFNHGFEYSRELGQLIIKSQYNPLALECMLYHAYQETWSPEHYLELVGEEMYLLSRSSTRCNSKDVWENGRTKNTLLIFLEFRKMIVSEYVLERKHAKSSDKYSRLLVFFHILGLVQEKEVHKSALFFLFPKHPDFLVDETLNNLVFLNILERCRAPDTYSMHRLIKACACYMMKITSPSEKSYHGMYGSGGMPGVNISSSSSQTNSGTSVEASPCLEVEDDIPNRDTFKGLAAALATNDNISRETSLRVHALAAQVSRNMASYT